jgi:phosphate-selective porin OprO/OprP
MRIQKYTTSVIIVFLFFFCVELSAQNLVNDSYGKGISFLAKDSSFYTKLGFRFQTLYTGQHNFESGAWSESMMIRRSRLKFDGWAFSPKVVYKIELGLSNRDTQGGQIPQSGNTAGIILDAVVKWNFSPGWNLWFGQTKLPGNRERVISSQKLQFVDRSLVNSRFNLDRDIGVQLHHKSKVGNAVLKQAFSVSTGEGRDIISDNPGHGRQYTARFELLPMGEFVSKGDYFGSDLKRENSPKLSIGITGDYNNNTVRSRGNLGSFVTDNDGDYVYSDLATVFIDGIFKYNGLSVVTEYVYRSASKKINSYGYGTGITGSAGYLFKNNMEFAGRATHIKPIYSLSSIPAINEYMIGFSKYVVGHNLKVQSDFSYTERKTSSNFLMFRLQCEVAF